MAKASSKSPKEGYDPAHSSEWVSEGVRQYTELLETADPLAVAVQLTLWQANHAQFIANTRAIEALGLPVSITGSRLAIMRALYCAPDKKMSLTGLARVAGISPTMVTNLIDALVKAGMVRRRVSDADRRVSLAELTPAGEETFRAVLPVMSSRMTEACASFTDDEKHTLISLLGRLCRVD